MMASRKRSVVWSFFTAEDDTLANCDVCRKSVRYCGNTTNLFKHMKSHEKDNPELVEKVKEVNAATDQCKALLRKNSLTMSFQRGKEYTRPMVAPRKRSIVWSYFTAVDENLANCSVCRKAVRYCGNTTNLFKHMKIHKKENSELKGKEKPKEQNAAADQGEALIGQSSLVQIFWNGEEYPGDSERSQDITRSLVEMIVKDLHPVSLVEGEGFTNLVKTLDPCYKIPSRKILMEGNVPAMYQECHSKVRKCLDVANSVVLTTDMWTSTHVDATEAYLTVSCHVIDEKWQMQTYVLETCSFAAQHSADDICSELKRISDEWVITDKVHGVVTDTGANMVAAVHKTGWVHYPSFAHTLDLVVKDSIEALPDLLDIQQRCSAIVSFFKNNTRAAEKLEEMQKQLNIPNHKLIQSVETRWNSVFCMLERLFEQKKAFTTVLCLLGENSLCLSEEDWTKISLSIDALRPFEEVTREISTEKNVSVSKVIPLVSLLLRATAAYERKGSKLAAELSVQCQRRFDGIESLYGFAVSTFLDSRFKNLGFRDSAHIETMKEWLITEMRSVIQDSATSESSSDSPSDPTSDSTSATSSASAMAPATTSSSTDAAASPPAPTAKGGLWAEFDNQVFASRQHRTTGTDVSFEMQLFSQEKAIPRDQDPLLWWKNNEQTFPTLSKLAKKHLGVLASSVPAERIFSKAGQLVCQRRSVLNPKHINMILFLNKNL